MTYIQAARLIRRISFSLLGTRSFILDLKFDSIYKDKKGIGRPYLQVRYFAPCTKTGTSQWWTGRKWYLSEFMTRDEVVKTAFAAYKAVIEHEVMESFRVDGKLVFNPHTPFTDLMKISHKEVKRKPKQLN